MNTDKYRMPSHTSAEYTRTLYVWEEGDRVYTSVWESSGAIHGPSPVDSALNLYSTIMTESQKGAGLRFIKAPYLVGVQSGRASALGQRCSR